jgi:hypothetical protein
MNDRECPHESAVRRAIHGDGWTDTLRLHVSQCASCQEVAQVTHFMSGAARAMARTAVPDARAAWTRIQLAELQQHAQRARRPVQLAWMFAKCWFAGIAGLIVYRDWPAIGSFLLNVPLYACVAIAAAVAVVFLGRQSQKR